MNTVSPELLGIFGLSFAEKVAAFMSKHLKGTAAAKNLKSFWSPGGVNTTLIDNLQREYAAEMAYGRQPASFVIPPDASGNGGTYTESSVALAGILSAKTNIDSAVILEFFRALFVLARDGKIPFAKWDPRGVMASTAAQKTFQSEKSIADIASGGLKTLAIIAGLGVGAYALSQLKPLMRKG